MPRKSKPKRDKKLVELVKKIGIRATARVLKLAPSTVHELYHKNKDNKFGRIKIAKPSKRSGYFSNYHKMNRQKRVFSMKTRNFLKLSGQRFTDITWEKWEELKRKCNNSCLSCKKKEPSVILTMEHIKSISRGGKHMLNNIQILCHSCNSKKRSAETVLGLSTV